MEEAFGLLVLRMFRAAASSEASSRSAIGGQGGGVRMECATVRVSLARLQDTHTSIEVRLPPESCEEGRGLGHC